VLDKASTINATLEIVGSNRIELRADMNSDIENTGFSEYLKMIRLARKMSLRDVENACGVSNAYLSQVEQGKVQKPSPQILHRLADAYLIGYDILMEKAGYITRKSSDTNASHKQRSGRLAAASLGQLTGDEERELLKYLAYIRSLQKK
jgi:transcriptional regulator with XRE-family HTH domain